MVEGVSPSRLEKYIRCIECKIEDIGVAGGWDSYKSQREQKFCFVSVGDGNGCRSLGRHGYTPSELIRARISSTRQQVVRSPSLIGFGYRDFATPSHQDDLLTGIIGAIPFFLSPKI